MKTTTAWAAAAGVLLCVTGAGAAEPAEAFKPLAFLAGHCWRGTFPDSTVTDEHCFSWVYGGKFMRDKHVVHHGAGQADNYGETIYLWDAAAAQLQYLYIESAGGFSRGSVTQEGSALVFPPTSYSEDGKTQTYRSRWQRAADDAYDVVTEFQREDKWVPGFSVHMLRTAR
jgi:hypothetical protein